MRAIPTLILTAALAVAVSGSDAFAFEGFPIDRAPQAGAADGLIAAAHYRHRLYRYGGYGNANGGYRVNRYGYGNYVGGPNGGFAGYPAGSGAAQIYRQKQKWKCEYAPEHC